MLCTPAVSVLVVHAAVRLLPLPVNATAEQAAIDVAPSLKLIVPVGIAPVTVAVKVTFVPTVDGLEELLSVVVVAVPPVVVRAWGHVATAPTRHAPSQCSVRTS